MLVIFCVNVTRELWTINETFWSKLVKYTRLNKVTLFSALSYGVVFRPRLYATAPPKVYSLFLAERQETLHSDTWADSSHN